MQQRLFFLFCLILIWQANFAQERLEAIRSTSERIDIRVGDDFFLKGGWILEPAKKPDVFHIESKWLYDVKKVTFTTDIDSLSFDVRPGNTYNLVILLDSTPCYIQVITLSNPVFMQGKFIIPILIGFISLFVLVYFRTKRMDIVKLLNFGYVATLFFWLMTFTSGIIHGNYNHFGNVISELGALGTKSEIFTAISLMLISAACALFSIGFYRASRNLDLYVIPAILTFSMPVTMFWAAVFPLRNEFHGVTGPLPLLLILACLLSIILWRKKSDLSALNMVSIISFFIMMLILLRFVKPVSQQFAGLVQRFFYLGWTVWTIAIGYYFTKKLKLNQ